MFVEMKGNKLVDFEERVLVRELYKGRLAKTEDVVKYLYFSDYIYGMNYGYSWNLFKSEGDIR